MRSRHITITIVTLIGVLLCLPSLSTALPAPAREAAGETSATLDADQASVTATGTFSYTVRVLPASGADSISARFELLNRAGRSIFLRTKYWTFDKEGAIAASGNGAADLLLPRPDAEGRYSYRFSRDLSDFELSAGRYDVRCTIRTSTLAGTTTQRLTSYLFVYDPAVSAAPAVLVVRVGAPPLRRTDGDFASDPATGTARQRSEELARLARGVLDHPQARLAIAPSPLLIEELADLADGCRYFNASGDPVDLAATSAPARYAATTLADLRRAIATGRLEVAWQGYADPNVSALQKYQLTDDLAAQYRQGTQVLQNVLGVKPALITAPYGDGTVMQARDDLLALGVRRVLPAGYNRVSQSLETSGLAAALAQLFDQQGQTRASAVVVGLPGDRRKASALLDDVEALQSCVWISFRSPTTATLRSLTENEGTRRQFAEAPYQNFLPVYQARVAARGLVSATAPDAQDALEATRFSLIAENAFGSQPAVGNVDQTTPHPESFTAATLRGVRRAFSVLKLKTHPVTLAGSSGEAPITVTNSSATQLKVHLEFSNPKGGLKVKPEKSPLLTVASNDTLFSPAVTLYTTGTNDLQVRLLADEYVICEDSVAISGSYLDIIGIVAIVVMVGAGLVFYIWRHSKGIQKGGTRVR
ncbi:MAG: hypothetical protein FWC54_01715 [Actinomycetia bacterium]|nr:hypothetical protein [Actinomycetes bacterium]